MSHERLLSIARDLVYTKEWNPQEMYILQTRDMITIKKKEHFRVVKEAEAQQTALLGKGIGVSGSALSGLAVFTDENIRQLRSEQPNVPLILIRQDTVPEDIREISLPQWWRPGWRRPAWSAAGICRSSRPRGAGPDQRPPDQIRRPGLPMDGRSGLFLRGTNHPVREEVHILPL